jgi:replicative DNA helicase
MAKAENGGAPGQRPVRQPAGVVPAAAAAGGGRVMPHSAEAEAGLLACCVLDGGRDTLTLCLEGHLRAESFFVPAHQILFQVLIDLYQKGSALDEVVVSDALRSRTAESIQWLVGRARAVHPDTSLIQLIGGPAVLAEITGRIDHTAHAGYWLEIVREKWMLRRLIHSANGISERAFINQDRLEQFLDEVEREVLAINQDWVQESAKTFASVVESSVLMIRNILDGNHQTGLPTGYIDLDALTFGMHPGEMIVLAARPSMGKTSLGMNIAENVALPRKGEAAKVLVFSLEMPAEQLSMRMLCGRARVNMKRVRDRMISRDNMKELVRVGGELKDAPIWVDDSSGLNVLELRAKARRVHQKEKLSLIVVDYLQLLNGLDSRTPREQQIAEISRGIKAMAKELEVPVLVLSQLNRSSEKENRDPRISDLRESGAIEQDADVIMLLASGSEKDEKTDIPQASPERRVIIAKNRNGPTGSVQMTFLAEFTRFENYQREPRT